MRPTHWPFLALAVLACSPPAEYTPEEATQRFVTTAPAADVLEAATKTLRDKSFETGEAGDGFVQGSRSRRLTHTYQGSGVTGGVRTVDTGTEWLYVRVTAAQARGFTRVSVAPLKGVQPEGSEARIQKPLNEGDVNLCKDIAEKIQKELEKAST